MADNTLTDVAFGTARGGKGAEITRAAIELGESVDVSKRTVDEVFGVSISGNVIRNNTIYQTRFLPVRARALATFLTAEHFGNRERLTRGNAFYGVWLRAGTGFGNIVIDNIAINMKGGQVYHCEVGKAPFAVERNVHYEQPPD